MESEEELINRIIEICTENPSGVTEKTLQLAMPGVDTAVRVKCINAILSQGKIEIFKQGQQLIYRLKVVDNIKLGDDEEKIVYAIIKEVGNKGIWSREIRNTSKLSMTQLNKVLKSMESRKLIKAVKSVAASKKKVYMIYDIEPDRSVTGGSWYSDQDFESEFIDVLNQQCFRFLQEKSATAKTHSDPILRRSSSYASLNDIWSFIKDLGISKVELSLDDIGSILETLVFDGRVEKQVIVDGSTTTKVYMAVNSLVKTTGLMKMPCGICPVINDCYIGGPISPSRCVYFNEWFDS